MAFSPGGGAAHDAEHQNIIQTLRASLVAAVSTLPDAITYTGYRFFDTTRNMEFYSDGARWLSSQKFLLPLGAQRALDPFPQATTFLEVNIPEHSQGIYVEKVFNNFFPNTAQSAANFYSFSCNLIRNDTGVTGSLGGTGTTKTFTTASRYYELDGGIVAGPGAIVWFAFQAIMTPTGAPGTFYWYATAVYRLIG